MRVLSVAGIPINVHTSWLLVYGLIRLDVMAPVTGVVILQGGKLWYLDRMVLLFEALKSQNPEYAAWEY